LPVVGSKFRTITGSWQVPGGDDVAAEADGETAAVVEGP
jgi:hypothetical protein